MGTLREFEQARIDIILYLAGDLNKYKKIAYPNKIIYSPKFKEYVLSKGWIKVSKKGLTNILEQFIEGKASILQMSQFSDFVLSMRMSVLEYEEENDEDDSVAEVITAFDFLLDYDKEGMPINGEFTEDRAEEYIKLLKREEWIEDSLDKNELKYNRLLLWKFRDIHGQGNFSDNIIQEGESLYLRYSLKDTSEMVALWIIVAVRNFDTFDFNELIRRMNISKEQIEEIFRSNKTFCRELLPLRFNAEKFKQRISILQIKLTEKKDMKVIEETIKRANDWVLENKIVFINKKEPEGKDENEK